MHSKPHKIGREVVGKEALTHDDPSEPESLAAVTRGLVTPGRSDSPVAKADPGTTPLLTHQNDADTDTESSDNAESGKNIFFY